MLSMIIAEIFDYSISPHPHILMGGERPSGTPSLLFGHLTRNLAVQFHRSVMMMSCDKLIKIMVDIT